MKVKNMTHRSTYAPSPAPVPEIDDALDWLASKPALDEVAAELRRLRVLMHDLDDVTELLRRHVLLAIGEPFPTKQPCGHLYGQDEPF